MSELDWAVQAAGMEAVVQALAAEAAGVWRGSGSLKTKDTRTKRVT